MSLLMWMPVCGPVPEFRIGVAGAMIYLFLQSVVPTVPAAWLTFAEGDRLRGLRQPVAALGHLGASDDQQLAGAIMKTGGWSVPVVDRDLPVLHEVRRSTQRVVRLQAARQDARGRDHRPRRDPADHGRRRARVRPERPSRTCDRPVIVVSGDMGSIRLDAMPASSRAASPSSVRPVRQRLRHAARPTAIETSGRIDASRARGRAVEAVEASTGVGAERAFGTWSSADHDDR